MYELMLKAAEGPLVIDITDHCSQPVIDLQLNLQKVHVIM